jgi:hypothetical protein
MEHSGIKRIIMDKPSSEDEDEKEYDDIRDTIIQKFSEPNVQLGTSPALTFIDKLNQVNNKQYTKEKNIYAE